jgi:dTDP-4-dehydrorhamnose 3,5-epimerase-like enzyme
MPKLIKIPTYIDSRGSLSVIEKILSFEIKRVFYIYDVVNSERGLHAHKKTIQALIVVSGSCDIYVGSQKKHKKFTLESPSNCLILNPEDFHWMNNFSVNTVLLVLASEPYDVNDYIYQENYK